MAQSKQIGVSLLIAFVLSILTILILPFGRAFRGPDASMAPLFFGALNLGLMYAAHRFLRKRSAALAQMKPAMTPERALIVLQAVISFFLLLGTMTPHRMFRQLRDGSTEPITEWGSIFREGDLIAGNFLLGMFLMLAAFGALYFVAGFFRSAKESDIES